MKQARSILAFLALWMLYGVMTESTDLHAYNLYQAGAEAIVDFKTFTLGHSKSLELRDCGDGDLFTFRQQKFVAKQPGIFLLAAAPYAILKVFGYDYLHDFDFLSGMTAWWTAGLLTALAVVLFFHFLISLGTAPFTSGLIALSFGLGSTFFPYTGIPHHDVVASVILLFSFMMWIRCPERGRLWILFSGMLLGLTLFFSMLPALLVAILLVFSLWHLGIKKSFIYGLGFFVGNLPLAFYNAYYFGNPLLQANMAGGYHDTFFHPTFLVFMRHLHDYFGFGIHMTVIKFMPIFALGLLGLLVLPRRHLKIQLLFIAFMLAQVIYLCCIETDGHCKYGPRYLMPLIPFALMGLMAFEHWTQKAVAAAVSLFSIAINALGALGGTMYCNNLVTFAPTAYWLQRSELLHQHRPLLPAVSVIFGFTLVFWIYLQIRNRGRMGIRHPFDPYSI